MLLERISLMGAVRFGLRRIEMFWIGGVRRERGVCVFRLMGRLDVDGALPQRLFRFDDEGWAGDGDFDYLYKGFCN